MDTTLGPFSVDDLGQLRPSDPEARPGFAVTWRERRVQALLHQAADAAQGQLDLTAFVGRVPSTAGPAPSLRRQALQAARHLPRLMPKGWRLCLAPDHSLQVEARIPLKLPISVVGLVTQTSLFLLALEPYLDVLEEEGLAAGTVNTCPG